MILLAFIVGAILGSFYLVVGTRLPLRENIITSRSRCDHCHTVLKWYELIPILSYIFQLGKCRHCGQKIAIEHFIVEIISGLLFLWGYYYYGLTLDYATYLVLVSLTLIIFISDLKYMIILDSPLIISGILLIIIKYFEVGLKGMFLAIIYGIILFVFMYIVKIIGDKIFKRESLGGGDIKLCFIIGVSLGYGYYGFYLGLITIVFSAFLAMPYAIASIYLLKKNELPYGPFLIAASTIVFIFIEKFSRLLVFFMI